MPIHIDAPVPGVLFDPADFRIRGWLWLEARHAEIVAIAAYDRDRLLGEMAGGGFHERADVNAKYGLPPGTRTGFEFPARHPTAAPREPFEFLIRARLRDGSQTPPLFTRLLAAPPPERHPFQLLCASVAPHARGLEIGAHVNPVAGLSPFYTDAVASYAGTTSRADFLSDARALPLPDGTLDYLCSSHVLEHLPDPIAALHEWHRVLRPGGLLYLVVPDKRFTFDEPRSVTTCEHLLRDFQEGTTDADAIGHMDEFVYQANWSMLSPNTTAAEVPQHQAAARARYLRELEQGLPIDIHFHTFTPESIDEVLRAAGFIGGSSPRFKLLAHAERYPPGRDDGIGLLLSRTSSDSDPAPAPETFALASTTKGVASLPLVCPVSLNPLRLERKPASTLVETRSGLRYPFVAGLPALLPPRGHAPARTWGDRSWRTTRVTAESTSAGAVLDEPIRSHLDEPLPSGNVDPLCFFIRGWLWLGSAQGSIVTVEAWVGETLIGETGALYVRTDVATAHWLEPETRTGFELFAHHATAVGGQPIEIEIRARLANGQRVARIFTIRVRAIERDYRRNHFGVLLDQRTTALQRRANVFAEGPSSTEPSGETALLLRRHLPKPPCRVIDVGCGVGSYGRGLLTDGYDWLGVEVDAADCAELTRLQLPHRQADGHSLPFADASFDAALCLDVLEHLEDPTAFVREISRVAPRQLIVTVPNCELLGYLWDHLAVPWHMLEGDHKNFFTRWSLGALLRPFYSRVEVRFQGPHPLRTIEGTPLYYHLFAVAQR